MDKEKVSRFYDVVWTEYIPEYEATEKHWEIFFSREEVRGKSVLDAGQEFLASFLPITGPVV